ncbi:MAG: dCMP deaminase family protein [Ekhidna sp.]|nr:dCMP deaminase family protein [Ekhidna sp.]
MTIKWDDRFLQLAEHIAAWSKDPSSKVGCVIADDKNEIVSVGFNGFPRGIQDDSRLQTRETKYPLIIHAEANALISARRDVSGCTAYVTHFPCIQCAVKLIQSGIVRVVTYYNHEFNERWKTDIEQTRKIFNEAKVVYQEKRRNDYS